MFGLQLFGVRRWRLRRPLNLDAIAKDKAIEGEYILESGEVAREKDVLHLIRLVLLQVITDQASSFHLLGGDGDARMLYYIPEGIYPTGWGWFEMVPPPTPVVRTMIRLLREIRVPDDRPDDGLLQYRYQRKVQEVRCWSPNTEEAIVYFSAERPATMDQVKQKSDVNG